MTEINSEADVKREVKKLLNKYGWRWWMPAGSAYGKNNVDFNALKYGKFLAIETKWDGNTPTKNQQDFLDETDKYGGYSFVINENNLNILKEFLESIDLPGRIAETQIA